MSDAVKTAYAVIETGGKQYRVSEGDTITVERLGDEAGSEITIDRVLMIGGNGATKIGTPVVDGASVTARRSWSSSTRRRSATAARPVTARSSPG
jgi:large subunit ribosomal protein L21